MNSVSEPVGTIEVALGHAARLLETNPSLALEQADEILKTFPGNPHARLILGAAQRRVGRTQSALEILAPLAREQQRSAQTHIELAIALGEADRATDAIAALRHALQLKPDSADAWGMLANQLDASGDTLDAVLCALQAAWAWQRRDAGFGEPPQMDALEGWIATVPF